MMIIIIIIIIIIMIVSRLPKLLFLNRFYGAVVCIQDVSIIYNKYLN